MGFYLGEHPWDGGIFWIVGLTCYWDYLWVHPQQGEGRGLVQEKGTSVDGF
jgi:hypothetical protein